VLAIRNCQPQARLGLIVAKRHLKQAVKRNYIKRAIRESFRQHQERLSGLDLVVLLKRKPDEQFKGQVICKCLEKHWAQLAEFLKHS
jgi:ribonuclease P protein component